MHFKALPSQQWTNQFEQHLQQVVPAGVFPLAQKEHNKKERLFMSD
jgi:hypothetical protein